MTLQGNTFDSLVSAGGAVFVNERTLNSEADLSEPHHYKFIDNVFTSNTAADSNGGGIYFSSPK